MIDRKILSPICSFLLLATALMLATPLLHAQPLPLGITENSALGLLSGKYELLIRDTILQAVAVPEPADSVERAQAEAIGHSYVRQSTRIRVAPFRLGGWQGIATLLFDSTGQLEWFEWEAGPELLETTISGFEHLDSVTITPGHDGYQEILEELNEIYGVGRSSIGTRSITEWDHETIFTYLVLNERGVFFNHYKPWF